ncbi:hypothetical protein G5714_024709 [Onychostoma macrolepis]|uniref:Uncharacterized protein n=1 Tax=Onychostoma macrolepis TaxID=369639 RepID=A0A7J6BHH9_9TELE|nr:hypothetical protein G5714_024709 [Onychostoma macrolepis]
MTPSRSHSLGAASHRPPLLRGTSGEPPRPVLQPNPGLPHLSPVTDSANRASGEPGHWSPWERFTAGHPGKSLPLVTPGEIYRWSPQDRLRFWPSRLGLPGFLGTLQPDLQNHDSGLRGEPQDTHSTRLREPGPRAEGGDSLTPTLPASGNQDLGQRGRLLHPLYPPQGTRTSGRGATSCTPLPASGNQDLGQRGRLLHPLYPPQGTRTSGRGATSCTPLPASGNQDLGQRGPLSCTPSTRLGEPGPRAEGAPFWPPPRLPGFPGLCEPDPRNHDSARGGTAHPFYCLELSSRPPLLRGPPDLQEGPLPRPPLEPGIPHLSPVLAASLGLPGFPGLCEPDPLNHDSGPRGHRTPSARLREPDAAEGPPHAPSATGSPHRLRFFPPPSACHWYPGTPQGVEPRPPGGPPPRPTKDWIEEDFQWIAASASQERGGAARRLPSSHEWFLRTGRPRRVDRYPRPIRAPRRCGIVTPRRDSDLEAFSHNPTDGSRTSGSSAKHTHKCLNLRFLSY